MKRASEEARARAAERAAHREHRRVVRARITALRAKLREAVSAKKARMKEIVRACRAQRLAARAQIAAMRKEALAELAASARGARETARTECNRRRSEARATYASYVDIARADLAAERQRQAEERRIAREERARHAAVKEAHRTGGVAHRRVRAPMAEALAPLAAKVTPAPGESPTEAVLKYAETHPEAAHAVLEPAAERAIEATAAQIATLERLANAPTPDDLARAGRAVSRSAARPPNAYELKKAARIECMRGRADKLKAASAGAFKHAEAIASRIPLGQPILVGHHSEKRHRRDLQRIDRGYGKAFSLGKEAEALRRRADFAEKNRAISSDDPDAVDKLRAKLAKLNAERAKWRLVNEEVRAARNEGDLRAGLARLGLPESLAKELLTPDAMGRTGIPAYQLTNAASEARRLEARIHALEASATAPEKPVEEVGSARIYEAENRVRIEFPAKPSEDVRTRLKGAGFRWAKALGVWQRHASNGAWYEARRIAALTGSP